MEHSIDKDFYGEFDENLFHELVLDNVLDPDKIQSNPNTKVGRAPSDQQGPQRLVVVRPMKNLSKFSYEKTELANNYLDAFDDYLEIQQIKVVDANVAQITTRFGYSFLHLAKSQSSLTRVELVDHMPM